MPGRTPVAPSRLPGLMFVWLGGVAFVTSLLYFLYFYAIRLGRPSTEGPVPESLAIDVGLFALFATHHSFMARPRVKCWLTRHVPAPYERSIYVWVASALFFATCWFWRGLPGGLHRVDGWAALPFYLAQVSGILLAVVSARAIDVFDLSGIRQVRHDAPTHEAAPRNASHLETGGPYRLVRHPVYFGTLVLMAASPNLTTSRLVFTGLSLVYLVIGVALEERGLRDQFGAAYDVYRARVRWRMIPGIY